MGMKNSGYSFAIALAFSTLIFLGACSTSVENSLSVEEVQATQQAIPVLPTQLSGKQLQTSGNQACLLDNLESIQVSTPQGDLAAWSPVSDQLAYVQPTNQIWGWYLGSLVIFAPAKGDSTPVTQDQPVFGDLTWAPEGSSIAYVMFDQTNEDYTVNVVDLSGKTFTDIFSATANAKTDSWSSRKGIQEWSGMDHLVVRSSCGADCIREFDYDINTSTLNVSGEMRKSEDTSLTPNNEGLSPNGDWTVTVDGNNNIWFSSTDGNQVSLLLADTAINEVKWSPSSKYFALRTKDRLLIYEAVCSANSQ